MKVVTPKKEVGSPEDLRISGYLNSRGFRLSNANPSFLFLKKPKEGRFPLIIIDVKQKLEDGLELINFPEEATFGVPTELQGVTNKNVTGLLFGLARSMLGTTTN